MAADDLNKPLGLSPPRASAPRRRWKPYVAAGAASLVVVAAAVGGWAWYASGPAGPTATASIVNPAADAVDAPSPERTGTILAGPALSEIQPSGELTELNQIIIHGLPDAPVQLAAYPDDALIEQTEDGPLPRIGSDGMRPLDAYARPNTAGPRDTRIAIVIGGIGIDEASTQNALATLPGEVTLAFAPYGENLDRTLAAAREGGHEVLLQVPLEPFGYPRNDPGPNTLTAKAGAEENISRLHWFMSRITNYVGVINYMGARFVSEADAMAPVMAEVGRRGLLYLDDGSSTRSAAEATAAGVTPFARADLVLDADLSAAAIDQQLRQLQAIATQRGYAIATGTAFPMTVERVAAFVRAAKDRGVAVVPISAMIAGRS